MRLSSGHEIYSATAMLVTSQATIADCSSPQLSVQNLPICTPPIGGSEWPTSTQIFNKADILPAQMYVGISQPENLDRIWVIPDVGIRA